MIDEKDLVKGTFVSLKLDLCRGKTFWSRPQPLFGLSVYALWPAPMLSWTHATPPHWPSRSSKTYYMSEEASMRLAIKMKRELYLVSSWLHQA